MNQEFKEVAVEINSIFDNLPMDLLNKIPLRIRDFFKDNASTTYSFVYDKSKRLNEQHLKDKTRGIISILYRDFLCNDVERKEYYDIYTKYLDKKENEKRVLYNPNDIVKITNKKISDKENTNYLERVNKKTNIIKKIWGKILRFFNKGIY